MPATILLVEDNLDLQTLYRRALENEGYVVLIASNGEEGICLLEHIHVDLVLLDLMMPIMDGYEFLKIKNRRQALSPIPVLVMSAVAEHPAPTGSRAYLTKPVNLEAMLNCIDNIFRNSI